MRLQRTVMPAARAAFPHDPKPCGSGTRIRTPEVAGVVRIVVRLRALDGRGALDDAAAAAAPFVGWLFRSGGDHDPDDVGVTVSEVGKCALDLAKRVRGTD